MNFSDIRQVYFLGIGGIGMSAIARYFRQMGKTVSGYDRSETILTREMISEGIRIHYEDLGAQLAAGYNPADTLVVLTPAIPKDHEEWRGFREGGFSILKRSQVLGLISDAYKTIAVAGTHGKTTTSTLIAHILKQSSSGCVAFLGGISGNYNTNLLLAEHNTAATQDQLLVTEADEFDRSFLTLHPYISVITSTDADHLDIYGEHAALKKSFTDFAHNLREGGVLFTKTGIGLDEMLSMGNNRRLKNYSITEKADVYADRIRIEGDRYYFDLHYAGGTITDLYLGIPGKHNVENATAAAAATLEAGVSKEELRSALASFTGVKRRFEYIIKTPRVVYIDDYAHHPEELRAIISSVKQMYHDKKITVIFQPHLYSRTRDFADGFAESLSLADDVLLLDIYPARELPIPGVTSGMVFEKMTAGNKMRCAKEDVVTIISEKKPEVLLTLGAGDIDQLVEPLRELMNRINKAG